MNHYENRDAAFKRLREHEENLDLLIEERPREVARNFGLDRPAAPLPAASSRDASPPPPSPPAVRLSLLLLEHAERTIEATFSENPELARSPLISSKTDERLPYIATDYVDSSGHRGELVPLLTGWCPHIAGRLPYQLVAYEMRQFKFIHDYLAAQLSQALVVEDDLWVNHARQERIPYPFTYWALQHLRKPRAKPGNASLCIRCGRLLYTRTRARPARRCSPCARELAPARQWPAHAVMPHTRGQWWLRCQAAGCLSIFRGSAQALYCSPHRLRNVTPRARAAIRA